MFTTMMLTLDVDLYTTSQLLDNTDVKINFRTVLLKNGHLFPSVFINFNIFGHEFVTPYHIKYYVLCHRCV